jgi:lysozyme
MMSSLIMNRLAKGAAAFSAAGLIALAAHEGFSSKPYLDTGGIWTNGFGNTRIEPEKTVTVEKGLQDLRTNIQLFERKVQSCITQPMSQGNLDAFVSFSYNVGGNAFCSSTMAKKFNAGDSAGACQEFMRWVYVAGKDCRIKANNCSGIVKRREAERDMCLGVAS